MSVTDKYFSTSFISGGRIDHGHHENKAFQALHDTLEFNKAVQTGLDNLDTSKQSFVKQLLLIQQLSLMKIDNEEIHHLRR